MSSTSAPRLAGMGGDLPRCGLRCGIAPAQSIWQPEIAHTPEKSRYGFRWTYRNLASESTLLGIVR